MVVREEGLAPDVHARLTQGPTEALGPRDSGEKKGGLALPRTEGSASTVRPLQLGDEMPGSDRGPAGGCFSPSQPDQVRARQRRRGLPQRPARKQVTVSEPVHDDD